MVRLLKTVFVLSIGSWSCSPAQQSAAQQAVEIPTGAIHVADLGLEAELSSAADLVGPADGAPGRNRAALLERMQCWIDGVATCTVAGLNDPRVRTIRSFLGSVPADRHGIVVVQFPDDSRVQLHLERVADPEPHDWTKPAYQLEILSNTVQAL